MPGSVQIKSFDGGERYAHRTHCLPSPSLLLRTLIALLVARGVSFDLAKTSEESVYAPL
jgi:hypothetical protein